MVDINGLRCYIHTEVRQALLSQGETLSLKFLRTGSITISLVSTKHWVAEIGFLKKLQIGTEVFKDVLQ